MDTGGREVGGGEMYGESTMEIYNTTCKIDSQWEFAVWLRELKQGLCDDLEGQDGEADGREVWEGGDMGIPMTDSCWYMTENHKILQSDYPSIKKIKWQKKKKRIHREKGLPQDSDNLKRKAFIHSWLILELQPPLLPPGVFKEQITSLPSPDHSGLASPQSLY